jgi:sodium-independent sulfate anion transporter 11
VATVLITVFSTIENGVYASICAALALLLLRVAHPRGNFLGKVTVGSDSKHTREIFLPLARSGNAGSDTTVVPASPGIVIYRFEESFVYPNCAIAVEELVDYVKLNMRRGQELSRRDRLWNDPGPSSDVAENESKPVLRAIVLDFSTVYG